MSDLERLAQWMQAVSILMTYKEDIARTLAMHIWLVNCTYTFDDDIQPLCYLFRGPNHSDDQQWFFLAWLKSYSPPSLQKLWNQQCSSS